MDTSQALEALEALEASAVVATRRDYHPELSTSALIAEVRKQLASERRAGRLVCRYLADLADRIRARDDDELLGYVDEFHAAACFFDLGARETRERVRIGRALRSLPQLEAAFVAGDVSYSRVREVTRVAQPGTESAWLELARKLDMRALERRVSAACTVRSSPEAAPAGGACVLTPMKGWTTNDGDTTSAGDMTSAGDNARAARVTPRAPARACTERLAGDTVRVTFELSTRAWALVERALDAARQRAAAQGPAAELSDAEALEAIAREGVPEDVAEDHVGDSELLKAASSERLDADAVVTGPALEMAHADQRTEPTTGETATQRGFTNGASARLLCLVGRGGRWSLDDLAHESGLGVPALQHALLLLELEGRIRCRSGWVELAATSRAGGSVPIRSPRSARPRSRPGAPARPPHQGPGIANDRESTSDPPRAGFAA